MTSNIGSQRILSFQGAFEGAGYEAMKEAVLDELPPPLPPRVPPTASTRRSCFTRSTRSTWKEIAVVQLGRLRQRLAERHMDLELTSAAKTHLVRVGYDPAYGARPLKRAIQRARSRTRWGA